MKYALSIFFVIAILYGCERTVEDEIAPVFESLEINSTTFNPQDVITIDVGMRDNENMNQVRVRIQSAFSKSFGEWEAVEIREVSGQSYQGSFSFTVPDTAQAGYYQYSVQGADMRGNGTRDSINYFTILQPGFAPYLFGFNTIPPIVDNVLFLNSNDTLMFVGLAIDDNMLSEVSIDLRSTKNERIQLLSYTIPDSVGLWNLGLNVDSILPQYEEMYPASLIVKILDSDNNQTRREIPVDFTP